MFSIRKSSTELNNASELRWHFPSVTSATTSNHTLVSCVSIRTGRTRALSKKKPTLLTKNIWEM